MYVTGATLVCLVKIVLIIVSRIHAMPELTS
ncbi:MAG: hypothetical protein ACI909_003044 [Planctomycetota bacterium]|jgi:hypothetical protein